MAIFYNCIHWRVCALPCPLDVEECRHFKAEGDEIKHGHWVKGQKENSYYCSNCTWSIPYNKLGKPVFSPFCYKCGAKMDEGGEE